MIKLQDLAAQYKVTDRAIQKHLKKHEKELEGHFERKGPNGTWLDEYACNYIKELMRIQTVVTSDDPELQNRVKELELELAQLRGASAILKELYETEHEKFLEISKNQALLEGKIELEVQKTKLQAEKEKEAAIKEAEENLQKTHTAEMGKIRTEMNGWKAEAESYERTWFGLYRKKKGE